MNGYMYILLCADESYYTGSTNDLDSRIIERENGEGANYTKKRLPVKLVYFEEYDRIDDAFYREKQIQKWSRRKKAALIKGEHKLLSTLARNYTQYGRASECPLKEVGEDAGASASSATGVFGP